MNQLEEFLEALAREAQPGDRLPPIRELMRRFGASQVIVQRAFHALKARGLIDSQVGRGTFFRGPASGHVVMRPPATKSSVRSLLLLRRSISIARGRVLAEGLQRRFAAEGQHVLDLTYTDPAHARMVLRGLPHFDACVVQSTFKTLPIELLAALREKCGVIAVDGAALVGADVEAVGTEWGEPLALAVERLRARGHQRIAYASTSQSFLATQLGWRRFEQLQQRLTDVDLRPIRVPLLPDGDYAPALIEALRGQKDAGGRLPFSALVAWGIEDGAAFRAALADNGWAVPSKLSVVLLGRTDLPNEHGDFFDTIGCSVADQVDALHRAIHDRWADPRRPFGVHLTPVTLREGESTAEPGQRSPRARAAVSAARAADSPT